MRFLIVTGLSGAGKSQTVHILEDMGFFCVDNMPPELLPKFAEVCLQANNKLKRVAVVMDIRGGKSFNKLFDYLSDIEEKGLEYEILYLEANDEVLVKRFKETRRTHPLAKEGRVITGIAKERVILEKAREKATYIIDTSNLIVRQLKEQITTIFVEDKKYKGLVITVMSFGFKNGIPTDSDLVFDVRFLPNPFYIPELKPHTGKEDIIKEYVLKFEESTIFLNKTVDLLEFLIPNYIKEGKSQLVVSIGCTGGKHRSVVISEEISRLLAASNHKVTIEHRDINKDR
jgi:UPF0042 nucleotide-binding protein